MPPVGAAVVLADLVLVVLQAVNANALIARIVVLMSIRFFMTFYVLLLL